MVKLPLYIIVAILIGTLTACTPEEEIPNDENIIATAWAAVTISPTETAVPTPTPEPPSVLTVCMGDEPSSLFMYADTSASARGILQSVYDGPFDNHNGRVDPVILQQIPSLENGGADLHQVSVQNGTVIMDAFGNWVSLQEGVSYRPSGCLSEDCAQMYEGDQPVLMDELVVRFQILPEIMWSDGTPLTANDSVYSFNVAEQLFSNAMEVLRFTQSYLAIDVQTVEWKSIPGFQGIYATNFFSPLPQHLWSSMNVDDLLTAELTTQSPLGWGPYIIEEWTQGDHITLRRNENYFRSEEGGPLFDHLVYRFVENGQNALDALIVGECDYVDHTALEIENIRQLQSENQTKVIIKPTASYEQLIFGIDSAVEDRLDIFGQKEVRKAIAMCTNRQALAEQLFLDSYDIPKSFLLPSNIHHNPNIADYKYDPEKALKLLANVGWVDFDQDVSTPLTALGVSGIDDGTELIFDYLIPEDVLRQSVAESVQESLAQCGIKANLIVQDWEQFLEPGPVGSIFGRQFDLTQLAWSESLSSPCFLNMSNEIPGPMPGYSKGWGGANLAGYSNPEFDKACRTTKYTLPDIDENIQAHDLVQAIYAEDLPSIPLYWLPEIIAMRTDLCLINGEDESEFNLSAIEAFGYGNDCE